MARELSFKATSLGLKHSCLPSLAGLAGTQKRCLEGVGRFSNDGALRTVPGPRPCSPGGGRRVNSITEDLAPPGELLRALYSLQRSLGFSVRSHDAHGGPRRHRL